MLNFRGGELANWKINKLANEGDKDIAENTMFWAFCCE